jgi:regulator of protease activity HflC (stomatin/prohibitin superfamily)
MAIKVVLFIAFILLALVFAGVAGFKIYREYDDGDKPKWPVGLFGVLAVAMVVCTIFIPGNIHQVSTGEVAVVRDMGKVVGIREAGVYWDFYMTKKYDYYDTKVREIKIETQTYSKDNQIIGVTADLQYAIDSAQVDKIATEYGTIDKLESKITSIALDNIKSVFAQNTATDVINNRSQISANISQTVDTSINTGYYVNVKTIVLTNIDFTDDFEAAVAAKVAEEQKRQQALIEQERQLAEAENNKKIAIANAEAEARAAQLKADAEAEVARIRAQADQDVAKIEADTALYAGQKNAAIALQKLASVNGWTVVTYTDTKGTEDTSDDITYNKLVKPDETLVTDAELQVGVNKLLEVYKYEKWDGKLPTYQMGENGIISVVQP